MMNSMLSSIFSHQSSKDQTLRYERKYLVPNSLLDELRARIAPFVNNDENSHDIPGQKIKQYTVRSIYFDSPDLMCYHEKDGGLMMRRKLRVRSYNEYEPGKVALLEIKRKIGNRIKKHRANIYYSQLADLLSTGRYQDYVICKSEKKKQQNIEDAQRFLYHVFAHHFSPACLITYEREAFHYRFDSSVRITFDKNIRSMNNPGLTDLFEEARLKPLFSSHFILEIKYGSERMPDWLVAIVHDFRLRNEALSKYAIGLEVNLKYIY